MSKIMRVFYDNAGLPYKDSALSIHYPILEGGEFVGANNTTDIYFYTENLGDFYFVANCKLPNGALVDKLLIAGSDDFGTYYALSLDSELTENKGHLKVALKGYGGDVAIDEESDGETTIVVINGTPIIVATGIVDIAINYAPLVHHISSLTPTEYEELLAVIGTKLNVVDGIKVVATTSDASTSQNGQLYYVKSVKEFYRVVNHTLVKEYFECILVSNQTTGDLNEEQVEMLSNPKGYFVINNEIYVKTAQNIYANGFIDSYNDGSKITLTQGMCIITQLNDTYSYHAVDVTLGEFYNTTQADDKFVAKTDDNNVVYATGNSGDTVIPIDTLVTGKVVRRVDGSGNIIVGTATATNHAASKGYVDTFGKSLVVSINPTTYVMTLLLKDNNNNTLSTQTIDLPLESVVVNGEYDSDTQSLILTLQNGNTLIIPIGDLISDLASVEQVEILENNTKKEIDLLNLHDLNLLPKNNLSWEQGGIVSGILSQSNIRISTTLNISGSKELTFQTNQDLQIMIDAYDENDVWLGTCFVKELQSVNWAANGQTILLQNDVNYIKVSLRHSNDADILVEDLYGNPCFLYNKNVEGIKNNINLLKINKNNIVSFKEEDYDNGGILSDGTEGTSITRIKTKSSKAIDVLAGEKYRIEFLENSNWKVYLSFYQNSTFLSQTDYYTSSSDFVVPLSANKMRVVFGNDVDFSTVIVPAMINEIPITISSLSEIEKINKKLSGDDRYSFKKNIIVSTFNIGQFYNGITKCPDADINTQKARYVQMFNKYTPDLICTQENPEFANVSNTIYGKTFFEDRYEYYEGELSWLGQMFISNKPLLEKPVKTNYSVDIERYYEKTYVYFNSIKVALFNTHLSLTETDRATQISELITAMNQEEYVILCIDSNATDFTELAPFTNAGYKLANGGSFGQFITTYQGGIEDNIIVSSNINIEEVKVESSIFESLEDHYPLFAKLSIGIDTVDWEGEANGSDATNLTDEYNELLTYNTNDLVIHDNVLYKALQDNITGTWDSTKWVATTINEVMARREQALNIINASDIVSNTLTQAQYDLITNGKPTLIIGTIFSARNIMLFPTTIIENIAEVRGMAFGSYGNYNISFLCNFKIDNSTKEISLIGGGGSLSPIRLDNNGLALQRVLNINGMAIDGSVSYKTLAAGNIGSITSTNITTGWYKNVIAINSGLTNAKDVKVKMSNGYTYTPTGFSTSEIVIFSGVDFQSGGISVDTLYFKEN